MINIENSFSIGLTPHAGEFRVSLSAEDFSPCLIYNSEQIYALGDSCDLAAKLLAEGYSAGGVPTLIVSQQKNLSGLAKPSQYFGISSTGKLARGFPCTELTVSKLLERDTSFSIQALGADGIAALLSASYQEFEQIKFLLSLAKDQQREINTLRNLQSLIAWSRNAGNIPSWHQSLNYDALDSIEQSLNNIVNDVPSDLFGNAFVPTQSFFKTDYTNSGWIHVVSGESSLANRSLLTLSILKQLMQEQHEKPLVVIVNDYDISTQLLHSYMQTLIEGLSAKGIYLIIQTQSSNPLVHTDSNTFTKIDTGKIALSAPRSQSSTYTQRQRAPKKTKTSSYSNEQQESLRDSIKIDPDKNSSAKAEASKESVKPSSLLDSVTNFISGRWFS